MDLSKLVFNNHTINEFKRMIDPSYQHNSAIRDLLSKLVRDNLVSVRPTRHEGVCRIKVAYKEQVLLLVANGEKVITVHVDQPI